MNPLAELTNRTPSPSQKDEPYAARKHSPWTAARQKKKTRSLQPSSDATAVDHQETIPEACNSPVANSSLDGTSTQFSLASQLCQSAGEQDVHVTPTLPAASSNNTGHSVPLSMDLGTVGKSLAAAAAADAHDSIRSPAWFCRSALHADVEGSEAECNSDGLLPASNSPPRGGNLFDKFGEVAHHQQQLQEACVHNPQLDGQQHSQQQCPQQQQEQHAWQEGPGGAARQCRTRGPHTNQSKSRDAAGACSRQLQQNGKRPWRPAAAASMQCSRPQYVLQATLAHDANTTEQLDRCSNSVQTGRLLLESHRAQDSSSWAAHALPGTGKFGSSALLGEEDCSTDSALQWLEVQMQQAVDQGDMPAARQLWESLQATDLQPSRTFMHCYLMCCQYGGVDPVEAQEAVRDMCMAADMQPDGTTAQLLAAIDIGWQQLQWTV